MIRGRGPESKLMLIGDYPSNEELTQKLSWTGFTNNLMVRLFNSHNVQAYGKVNIESIYRTIYIKEENKWANILSNQSKSWAKPQIREALLNLQTEKYNEILLEEIKAISPKVILSVGELPLNFLTSEKKINAFRGSPLFTNRVELQEQIAVIPIMRLQDIFGEPRSFYWTANDIAKAVKYTQTPLRPLAERYFPWVCRKSEDLYAFIKRSKEQDPPYLVFDIETMHNFITCISFCFDGWESCSVPLNDESIPNNEYAAMYRLIYQLLKSDIPKVNQNIKYDWHILEFFGFIVNNVVGDNMLLQHTNYCEFPRGLDFITSIYTDIPYYKDEGRDFKPEHGNWNRLYIYNAWDSIAAWEAYKGQLKEAEELETLDLYKKIVVPSITIYKQVDSQGILVSEEVKNILLDKYTYMRQCKMEMLQQTFGEEIKQKFGKPVNPESHLQMEYLVYGILNCPRVKKISKQTHEMTLMTDEKTLTEMWLNLVDNQFIKEILQIIVIIRKLNNIIEFLETPLHPDGTVRTWYKLEGTVSGRTSGTKTVDYRLIRNGKNWKKQKLGRAFQTIPKHGYEIDNIGKDLRKIFVPRKGKCFICGDSSQAEARVVTVLADDFDFLKEFDRFPGIHRLTASWIFGIDPKTISKDSREYFLGKKGRHAGNYAVEAYTLSLETHISRREAKLVLDKFHEKSPKIRGVFHELIDSEFKNPIPVLRSPHGRIHAFLSKNERQENEGGEKAAYSFIPQAAVTDNTKNAMIEINKNKKIVPIIESHDGLTYEVDLADKYIFSLALKRAMEGEINFNNCSIKRDFVLVIPAEIEFSESNLCEMEQIHF